MTLADKSDPKALSELYEKEAEDLAQIIAGKHRLPYIDLSRVSIDLDALRLVEAEEARLGMLAVFQKIGKKLQLALTNPDIPKTKDILDSLNRQGYALQIFLCSQNSLKRAWDRYREVKEFAETKRGFIDVSPERIKEFAEKIKSIEGFNVLLKPAVASLEQRKTSEILEMILGGAFQLEASDIHIEPQEHEVRLRLRMDGVLHDVIFIPSRVYKLLLSRIKLVSELKLNVHNEAQDGRFSIRLEDVDIEVRTSILPGPYGETIVLRILDPNAISVELQDLGMQPYILEIVERQLKIPNGMILTTGPTGSGKTTTLYAFVKRKLSPGINIITIEDPIEYHLTGITQTQVNLDHGYTFVGGLRAILRQDPDVILVGEIRDKETADTAMHAALTGHLVFSTLHTNNAVSTIPRLIDLGVRPAIIAPAINVAMAQRLVRKLCQKCKKNEAPTGSELKRINDMIKELPVSFKKDLKEKEVVVSRAVGCASCNNIGYKRRIGVFEVLIIDDRIEQMILQSPTHKQLSDEMKRQGMITLFQDGILKVLAGITSLEEVERVAGAK